MTDQHDHLLISEHVSGFLTWLNLSCKVSHANCKKARLFILQIAQAAQRLPEGSITSNLFAKDVCTDIKSLNITPDLVKTVACPACFHLYPTTNVQDTCKFKEVKGAKKCDEPLFRCKISFPAISDKGKQHLKPYRLVPERLLLEVQIPRLLYFTQKIVSWVTWFLNKEEMEDGIESWDTLVAKKPAEVVEDIQQAPAWKSLGWLQTTSLYDPPALHLVFSLFIDWFNPMGNKQAGKKLSMGLIAMNCLNMLPKTRRLLSNFCIAGMTLGAHQPSVTTVNHFLSPIVNQLLILKEGIKICTKKFPGGRLVQIKLLGMVGDVVATHKVCGYAHTLQLLPAHIASVTSSQGLILN